MSPAQAAALLGSNISENVIRELIKRHVLRSFGEDIQADDLNALRSNNASLVILGRVRKEIAQQEASTGQ